MESMMHAHLVEVDEKNRTISIYRLANGKPQFYTSAQIPAGRYDENPERFKQFFQVLGENIVIDSPNGRRCLGIDSDSWPA